MNIVHEGWMRISTLVLITSIFAAALTTSCGNKNNTTINTNIPDTQTLTSTPTPSEPVKIGGITSWSGPVAMAGLLADQVIKLVEKQVKDSGGILGGRDVKVIKYDNRNSVAEAAAGAKKLYYDDKVSALVFGGTGGTEIEAVADTAEELKILFVSFGYGPWLPSKTCSVSPGIGRDEVVQQWVSLANDLLKAKTVAFLAADLTDNRARVEQTKQELEGLGIKTVYEDFTPADITDFTSYLTKIKYAQPDVLILEHTSPGFDVTIAKQIPELGGLGNTQVLALSGAESAVTLPGAQGWYVLVPWLATSEYPGAVKFRNDFQAVNGRSPSTTHVYFYNCLWTAIHAIELAGNDRDLQNIVTAARSGKLEWDSPMGRAHFNESGSAGLRYSIAHVEGQKLVLATNP